MGIKQCIRTTIRDDNNSYMETYEKGTVPCAGCGELSGISICDVSTCGSLEEQAQKIVEFLVLTQGPLSRRSTGLTAFSSGGEGNKEVPTLCQLPR